MHKLDNQEAFECNIIFFVRIVKIIEFEILNSKNINYLVDYFTIICDRESMT